MTITPTRAADLLALLPERLNLNDQVEVRLTDKGVERLDAYYAELRANVQPAAQHLFWPRPADENGLRHYTVHELMNVYGPVCYTGGEFVFEHGDILLSRRTDYADALRTIAAQAEALAGLWPLLVEYDAADAACGATQGIAFRDAEERRRVATVALTDGLWALLEAQP